MCPHKSLRIFNLLKTNVDNCRPGRKCLVYFLCKKIDTKGSQLYLNEATAINAINAINATNVINSTNVTSAKTQSPHPYLNE